MAKKSTALVAFDKELADLIAESAKAEANTGGGQFFSTRGGQLSFNDAPLPGNQMAVIIVDHMLENVFYENSYDPDAPASPLCYAFGRSDNEIKPHEQCDKPQAATCAECPHNQFGSAEKGKGKACRNRRRLALISGGSIAKDGSFAAIGEIPSDVQVGYLGLPPTSIKGFGAYINQLVALKQAPLATYTRVWVEADPKAQFKVKFESLGTVPREMLPALLKLNKMQKELTAFPYPKVEAPKAKAPKRPAKF
jgi:hypothetical protein